MAVAGTTTDAAVVVFLITVLSISVSAAAAAGTTTFGCYESIVSFGDSLTDTGNILSVAVHKAMPPTGKPPFGRTFFNRPTGRYCDGRLVIDFIAQSLGLPLLKPYFSDGGNEEERRRSLATGVNFAVAGATVLDSEFYDKIGYHNPVTNNSLTIQLDWFRSFLTRLPDGRKYVERSLVVVGEIGVNDYNYLLQQGTTLDQLQTLVPQVVSSIGSTIQELIKHGVATMLVPGHPPIGCWPIYLTLHNSGTDKYDPRTGCLDWLNDFSKYHNSLLLEELEKIRDLHPQINIIYADYYNAAMRMYLSPDKFGFGSRVLRGCCGGGGPYNYNTSAGCGDEGVESCDNPGSYASWDGVHYTEAGNRVIAQGILEGPYTNPRIATICPDESELSLQPRGHYTLFMVIIFSLAANLCIQNVCVKFHHRRKSL
ncbi:GDSL esterase/lipase At1g31550-like [Andrographis paniculata]|uniref:GDSL esterase/lipase At1g31550-like n=1 Tax=Andrographis paniculata TaxID=175694 RepID=UPI0021E81F39|nr:GDSL esterase/lipase At1g31550-like [Andrographis paniculata]